MRKLMIAAFAVVIAIFSTISFFSYGDASVPSSKDRIAALTASLAEVRQQESVIGDFQKEISYKQALILRFTRLENWDEFLEKAKKDWEVAVDAADPSATVRGNVVFHSLEYRLRVDEAAQWLVMLEKCSEGQHLWWFSFNELSQKRVELLSKSLFLMQERAELLAQE